MNTEQYYKEHLEPLFFSRELSSEDIIIELRNFAQQEVENALQAAAEKVTMSLTYPDPYEDSNENGLTSVSTDDASRGGECSIVEIEKESILNAYKVE